MIYHVLPGDAISLEFKETRIEGDMIICRECLVVGPVDAETLPEFWDARARFISAEYAEDMIEYHEKVADVLSLLSELEADSEVNLWFEYELFCSVNLWFCIAMLKESGCPVYRVAPVVNSNEDRWKGFGSLGPDDLKKCFDQRVRLTDDDIELGAELWNAFRKGDNDQLAKLADPESKSFPYLKEVCDAAVVRSTRPANLLREIIDSGVEEFSEIFSEFSKRAGVYG